MEQVIIINGYNRTVFYDLSRGKYSFAPNEINVLILKIEGQSIESMDEFNETEKEWMQFLIDKEFIYTVPKSTFSNFTKLSTVWHSPELITNCIIDSNHGNVIKKGLEVCNSLFCKQVRIRTEFNKNNLQLIEANVILNNIQGLELQITSVLSAKEKTWIKDWKDDQPILRLLIFSTPETNSINTRPHLSVNSKLFFESQHQNNYFNQKMYIGSEGVIINAIETNEEFGSIFDFNSIDELRSLIASKEFKKYWGLSKDKCDVCKDCELRMMCVESRLPIIRENGTAYFETECDYNPYISKWVDEEGYKSLKELQIYSQNKGQVIHKGLVSNINKELWT